MYIIHTESSCGWGGQEIRILSEVKGMMKHGHKIEIWAPKDSNIFAVAKSMHIPAYPIQVDKKSLLTIFRVRNKIAISNPDIINTHSSSDSWVVSVACSILSTPPPCIRTRHISATVNNNFLTKWLYTHAAKHIIVTGDALKNNLINDNGFSEQKITSVPTGVDVKHFHPGDRSRERIKLGLPLNKYIVGIVATLRSWKGHDDLLDAIPLLQQDDILFLIVGDGPRQLHLKQKAKSLGLDTSKLLFVGQQQDVAPWFQSMDIAILPSYANEGVPQSLMQAMACGIPVISTPVGSIEELVIDGVTGILIPKNSPKHISLSIDSLINDNKTKKRLIKAGTEHIKKHYTLDKMIERMERIMHKIVKHHG